MTDNRQIEPRPGENGSIDVRPIDNWPRHLAALREARRLTALVLANNPDFRALQGAGVAREPKAAELPAVQSTDRVHQAYDHLSAALALLEPPACETLSARLADQIALLPQRAVEPCPERASSIPEQKLALQLFPLTAIAGEERMHGAGGRVTDVASVAIVCQEPSARRPTLPPPPFLRVMAHR